MKNEIELFEQRLKSFQACHMPADLKIMDKFLALLELNFREVRNPLFYAVRLDISLWRLNYICKAHLKLSCYEIMQKRIHQEATTLLTHSLLTVREIAFALGMNDPSYFCKCFKKITGVSPANFRELYKSY